MNESSSSKLQSNINPKVVEKELQLNDKKGNENTFLKSNHCTQLKSNQNSFFISFKLKTKMQNTLAPS